MKFSLGFNTLSFFLTIVSLVFLILACISPPVVKSFALGSSEASKFGIFGYCSQGQCYLSYPYEFKESDSTTWLLSKNDRNTLAKIFVVCPIAAGLNFLCLVVLFISHFNSSGILIFTLLLNLLSFLATALICIIVIITFYPNVEWTAWILVGAAAASLISLPFEVLALKLQKVDTDDEKNNSFDLTRFEDNISLNPRTGDYEGINPEAKRVSVNDDYDYQVVKLPYEETSNVQVNSSFTNSSINDTKPHDAHDLTAERPVESSFNDNNGRINIVEGPNTPIHSRQQMAPNLKPNVAMPSVNESLGMAYNRSAENTPYDVNDFEDESTGLGNAPKSDDLDYEAESDYSSGQQGSLQGQYTLQNQVGVPYNTLYATPLYPPMQYSAVQYPLPYYKVPQVPYQPQYPPPHQPHYGPPPRLHGHVAGDGYSPYINRVPQRQKPNILDTALDTNPDFSVGAAGNKKNNRGTKGNFPLASQIGMR